MKIEAKKKLIYLTNKYMIATSSDEAFVMLSMFLLEALCDECDLFFRGKNRFLEASQHKFELHEEEHCRC